MRRPILAPHPLLTALDTDKDGELSADEIANAPKALLKLDKNGDGKLSREELRPPLRPPGEGGDGEGPSADKFVERIMGFDKNKDGKVSKEELPERMQRVFDRADANKDGFIDKDEAKKLGEEMLRRRGEAGPGPGPGPRRSGEGPPDRTGPRPQPPQPPQPPRPPDPE